MEICVKTIDRVLVVDEGQLSLDHLRGYVGKEQDNTRGLSWAIVKGNPGC